MQRPNPYMMRGGLDLVTPAVAMPSGHCIAAMNYEPLMEGYGRIGGYERFDGRPRPHLATYWMQRFADGLTEPAVGDTVTGPSGSGIVLAAPIIEGEWGTDAAWAAEPAFWDAELLIWGDLAVGSVALGELSGTIDDEDDLTFATAVGSPAERAAVTSEEDVEYLSAATERRRDLIEVVPGSGPVRGVAWFGGKAYAIRDNAGGTAGVLHVSSGSGWAAIAPNATVAFTAGTARFQDGETLTQGGASATIVRQATSSGSYDGNDASGYLVLGSITGTFAAGVATSASGSATIAGAPAVTALPPSGHYDFVEHNFRGATSSKSLYFCGGVGPAHEYNPTDGLSPIFAPAEAGHPIHVAHFQNHLFLGYDGGALFSGIGEPFDWRTTAGAGDIGFGASVTGFVSGSETSLIISGASKTAYVIGTSAADFELKELSDESGGKRWSVQSPGKPVYMEPIGLRDLTASDTLGGWKRGTLTGLIEPLFRKQALEPVASVLVRGKNQYRVFWTEGRGLTVHLGREQPECMPTQYGVNVFCANSALDLDENEIVLIGSDNGFVYQLDVGTSFDGDPIEAMLRMSYNHTGSPYYNKRFHSAWLEIEAGGDVALDATAEYGYGDPALAVGAETQAQMSSGGGVWESAEWDRFYWSAREKGVAKIPLRGFGPNVSLAIMSRSATEQPHILSTVIYNTTQRGHVRK